MRSQLEAVFFLNPGQAQWLPEIRKVVKKYGVPIIKETNAEITLVLRSKETTQTLFALSSQQPCLLEGVIIYGRFHYPEILVLHLALARLGPISGLVALERSGGLDFLGLMTAFNKVVKTISGVERVRFAYWDIAIPLV
jgi:hypothetical protein